MKKLDMEKIARTMGAGRNEVDARGGYFGALQLAEDVKSLRTPASGGRPTDPAWEKRLIGVSSRTEMVLDEIAKQMSKRSGKPIGPMQVAALLLDRAVRQFQANEQLDRIEAGTGEETALAGPTNPATRPSRTGAVEFPSTRSSVEPRKKRAAGVRR